AGKAGDGKPPPLRPAGNAQAAGSCQKHAATGFSVDRRRGLPQDAARKQAAAQTDARNRRSDSAHRRPATRPGLRRKLTSDKAGPDEDATAVVKIEYNKTSPNVGGSSQNRKFY